MLNCSGIIKESIVDGDGIRYVIFTQGCPHHCVDCQNPSTWSYSENELFDIDELFQDILKNPLLSGVTFSGGEPFLQSRQLSALARWLHIYDKNVWCYTGYTYEQLIEQNNKDNIELLNNVDVLVDGEFIREKKNLSLKFRGSENQRVIDMNETRKQNKVVLKYE